MKCHYEILGLSMKASDEEIKKSYRKLALQWHPDKNPDRIQECTKQFNLIQQAYDVLIDPQERAWYDRHRDAILKGGLDEHYEDNSLNLFPYFVSGCYEGYGDDEKGFYTVYRHVFETIVNEDAAFMEDQEKGVKAMPSFGYSNSNYEEIVGPFYGYWQSYCTHKTYSWLDKYDIREAPNRHVLRAMEKENKKTRDAARKERNEEVRELVAFVRKRDRRVKAHRQFLAEQRLKQMKKVEEHRRTQIESRLREIGEYKEADWHDSQAREDALQAIEANLAQDFGDGSSGSEEKSDAESDEEDSSSFYCPACEKAFKTPKAYKNHENSKKHKESVKALKLHMTEEEFKTLILDHAAGDDEKEEEEGEKSKKNKKSRRRQKDTDVEPDDESENEDVALNSSLAEADNATGEEDGGPMGSSRGEDEQGEKQSEPVENSANRLKEEASVPCQTCSELFPSRNKLFQHLKETGHAAIKSQSSETSRSSKKLKNRKEKKIR